ncbi:DNA primase family protein [Tateyamaria pelophila]|uniref:DNA primase family protein n=1 Tax=Tateyamaria pelophila TaxID=328415 RepID=UPI001CBFDFC4|nr:phage/plasmid primase, P4 family [Tateyamaria pelophila]
MKFGILTHAATNSAPEGKHRYPMPDGTLGKHTEGTLVACKYQTFEAPTLQAFYEWLYHAPSTQYMTQGIADHQTADVYPRPVVAELGDTSTAVMSRTQDDIHWPEGAALMVVDSDANGEQITVEQVWAALCMAEPKLAGYACLHTTSSSSNVVYLDTNTGIGGLHTYLHVTDGTDIPRALHALHVRLCLRGQARHKLSRDGKFLDRSFVDMAMKTPQQPAYIRAHCVPPVTQDKQFWMRKGVEMLDTRAVIPDLTQTELAEFDAHLVMAKAGMQDQIDAVRDQYRNERAEEIANDTGVSHETALATVDAMLTTQVLCSDFVLTVGREKVTVGQILAQPAKWHGVACCDPVDPKGAGKTAAKIYSDQGQPMVNSFAHGGAKYTLTLLPSNPVLPEGARPVTQEVSQDVSRVPDSAEIECWLRNSFGVELEKRAIMGVERLDDTVRTFLDIHFKWNGQNTLMFWREVFYHWQGTHWQSVSDEWVGRALYHWLSKHVCCLRKVKDNWERTYFPATKPSIANHLAALKAVTGRPDALEYGWIDGRSGTWRGVRNGVLNFDTGELLHQDPAFFATAWIDAHWNPQASINGTALEGFLQDMMGGSDQITLLQEITGYLLSGSTDLQKAFMIIGKRRSGKGTYTKLLKALLKGSVASIRSTQIGETFTLEAAIDKSLLIVPDIRLSKDSNFAAMAETILTVTGEDHVDIARKHKTAWRGETTARLLMMANSIPLFRDSDGVLASRFQYLTCPNSFYGREDRTLPTRLMTELDVMLMWGVQGWQRLQRNNRFTETKTHKDLMMQSEVRMNPVGAWVAEYLEETNDDGAFLSSSELFYGWMHAPDKPLVGGFSAYAAENDVGMWTLDGFVKTLNSQNLRIERGRNSQGTERGFKGLKWRVSDTSATYSPQPTPT